MKSNIKQLVSALLNEYKNMILGDGADTRIHDTDFPHNWSKSQRQLIEDLYREDTGKELTSICDLIDWIKTKL